MTPEKSGEGMRIDPEDRSLGQLLSDATREGSELMRKEIELMKLEIAENLSNLKASVASMVVALPLLFSGLLILLAAAVFALDETLHRPWLSSVAVGGAVVVVGLIALLLGRRGIRAAELRPRRSEQSLRSDKQMLQRHVS
jgi:hypothetical protein